MCNKYGRTQLIEKTVIIVYLEKIKMRIKDIKIATPIFTTKKQK